MSPGEGAHGGGCHGAGRDPRVSSGPRRPPAAELASLLVRSVSYEAPALRKQISRCQQAQQDFARREEECQLAAAELRERFYASCKQYGITVSPSPVSQGCPGGVPTAPCCPWGELGVEGDASAAAQLWEQGEKLPGGVWVLLPHPNASLLHPQGDNVRQELLALVKELPSLLSEIGAGASALTEAIELYEACVEFVCERWAWGHDARGCLPVGPCWGGGRRELPALHLTLKSLRRPPAQQSRCCPCCGTWGGEATPLCTSGGRGSSLCAWSGRRCRRCRSSRRRTRCVRPCAAAAGWGGRQRPAGICLFPVFPLPSCSP